jgi:carbonic anhydrase
MRKLMQGAARFKTDVYPSRRGLFESLARTQHPSTLFLTCSDSRIDPLLITQSEPGELFICRNAGNIAPPFGEPGGGVGATIEYSVMVLGVRNIIVCGHSDCGALKASINPEALATYPVVASWLRHTEAARQIVAETESALDGDEMLMALIEHNVMAQIRNLRTHPAVAAREAAGQLELSGWVYDIPAGTVRVHSAEANRFVPVTEMLAKAGA